MGRVRFDRARPFFFVIIPEEKRLDKSRKIGYSNYRKVKKLYNQFLGGVP